MEENHNYHTTVLFRNDLGYQEVYSSQNYGTFYSVYLNFNVETDPDNEDLIILTEIEFKLINYKGVVNLGISDVEYVISENNEPKFIIHVQAMVGRRVFPYGDQEIDLSQLDKTLIIERTLLKLPNFDANESPNDNSILVFDDEFYYRDGPNVPRAKLPQAGMIGAPAQSGSLRCYSTINRIIL